MQATTTTPPVPDSPPSSDSSKKKPTNNNNKRAKASVACHECRKRKVKCEGIYPCGRCLKSNFKCTFPQQQSKTRGPPKHYIEILEARLQLMEKALRMIGGPAKEILDDALSLDPNAPQDKNSTYEDDTIIQQAKEYSTLSIQQLPDQYSINEIGQPYYTQHIHQQLRQQHQSIPPSAKDENETEPTTPSPSISHHLTDIDTSLIDLYFEHVHPYTPMIQKSSFSLQITNMTNNSPLPFIFLVYSMCAVATKWSAFYSTNSKPNEPPGFSYYQRAFALFDEVSVYPCITTIQALILLTKYQEQYKRAGYFYRPGYYLTIAVDMCDSLKLSSLVSSNGDVNSGDPFGYETKKRTFWMTFLYDLWTSIEEGRETRFNIIQCSTDYPSSNDGDGDDELMIRHNLVIRLARTLSDIYGFSRRLGLRQQIQGAVRTTNQQIEEEGRLLVMQTTLETYLRDISSMPPFDFAPSNTEITKYPVNPGSTLPNIFTGFLHMMYHYSIILLHRHHVLYPIAKQNDTECIQPPPFPHQQLCATSASIINTIAEAIMESATTLDVFHYPIRGVQFTILCVTMAIAVHKFEMETTQDEHRKSTANTLYWQALSIINKLSTETSAVEIAYLARDAELAEMCGKLAMDSNNNHNSNSNSNNHNHNHNSSSSSSSSTSNSSNSSALQPPPTGETMTYNNDISSSPILDSSILSTSTGSAADRINQSTKLANPRRGTVPGPHIRRPSPQTAQPDTAASSITAVPASPTSSSSSSSSPSSSPTLYTPVSSGQQLSPHDPSSTINPAVLFSSSAFITNPARLASLMQLGNIPTTSYNHQQQPTMISTSLQQPSQRHPQRSLHHHHSQSQEDLRSLNHQHMNNKAGYTRTAEPGGPPQGRLKKQRSMKFLPTHSQQSQHTLQQHPSSTLQMQQFSPQYQQPMHQQSYQHQPPMQNHHHYHHITANSIPSQQQANFSMMTATTPINRRHTISFASMDTSSYISPSVTTSLGYSSPATVPSASMMQMNTSITSNNGSDHTQYRLLPSTSLAATDTQSIPSTSAYTPMMMNDDPQMMMMMMMTNHGTNAAVGFTNKWTHGSFDMDRKVEGQACNDGLDA